MNNRIVSRLAARELEVITVQDLELVQQSDLPRDTSLYELRRQPAG